MTHVLLVDDDADIRSVASLAMRLIGGLEVFAVASGEKALEEGPRVRPAIVVVDLMMPGMDGVETLRQIRGQSWGAEVSVLLMSARAREDDAEYLGLGFDGVISKPFDPVALAERIKERAR